MLKARKSHTIKMYKTKEQKIEQSKYIRATKSLLSMSDHRFDRLMADALCIYDQALYYLRQEYFCCRDLGWSDQPKYPLWYDLCSLVSERECWNVKLDINCKKQVVFQALSAWNSWLKSSKDYKAHPEKYKAQPCMPKYLYRTRNWCPLKIDKTRFRGKETSKIAIPCNTDIVLDIPSNIKKDWIVELVITKKNNRTVVSFVYDIRKKKEHMNMLEKTRNSYHLSTERIMSIDFGKVNIATMMTYGCGTADNSYIIRGQYFENRINETLSKLSYLHSCAMKSKNKEVTKISRKDNQLKLFKNTNQMEHIWSSYNCFVDNQIGNISSMIIDCCLDKKIGRLIIGYNEDWKQYIELGRQNNKVFCHIPHSRLLEQLKIKAEMYGIEVTVVEESYTSKCDHMACEAMCHHDKYKGKRKSRDKFVSSTGKVIHGDVNGCIGMIRKANVIPDADLIVGLRDRGDVVSPVVLYVRGMHPRGQQSIKIA